jgi:hypothetical protein
MELKEIEHESVDCIYVALNRDRLRALVSMEIKLQVPLKMADFL